MFVWVHVMSEEQTQRAFKLVAEVLRLVAAALAGWYGGGGLTP